MGGGPATADVVRSSCFVTFPEETGAEPVPVDAWYLFAAGLTFLRRLARDRVGESMRIALLLQRPDEDGGGGRRYVSVGSNTVLQRALQETFDCPDQALVLHVISLAHVRGEKRIHVQPEVNPNVSPEPVARMGLVFPTLSVDGVVTPTAVEVPTADLSASLYEQMSRSAFNVRKDDSSLAWSRREDKPAKTLAQSAFFVEERDYTRRSSATSATGSDDRSEDVEEEITLTTEATREAKQVEQEEEQRMEAQEREIPMATVVETPDAAQIPSDYVMLELQTGAGLPAAPDTASSTYFISSHWAEQADEMSASIRLERPARPPARPLAASERTAGAHTNLDESFVLLERHEL